MTSASAVDLTAGGDGHRSVQDTDVLVENEGIQMRIDVRNIEVEEFRIDRELGANTLDSSDDDANQTPLYGAAQNGFIDVGTFLLDRGAGVYGDSEPPHVCCCCLRSRVHRCGADGKRRNVLLRFHCSGEHRRDGVRVERQPSAGVYDRELHSTLVTLKRWKS